MGILEGAGIIIFNVAAGFAAGAARELGSKCVQHHIEDIKEFKKAADQFVDEGWQRDKEAGGISSWGNQDNTDLELA